MGRTPTISDEQILEAAQEAFLELGMQATTSEIARRAGVSEGSIFRRFSSKETLFLACMGLDDPEFFATVDELSGCGELDENLANLGHQVIDFFLKLIPKMMLLTSSGVLSRNPQAGQDAPPVRGLMKITRYFEEEMELGRIRQADSEVLARMFIGAMHHYAFTETVGVNRLMPMPKHTYVREVVDMMLRGASEEGSRG
mgnify:CR=1 FL=1